MLRRVLTVLTVCAALAACGGGATFCADATIKDTCMMAADGPCRDAHGNTCIICDGKNVSNGCIYDPNAPLDGGTAVCVSSCTQCGAMCMPL